MGCTGADGPAVRAVSSMGNWNQARDRPTGTHTDASRQCTDAVEAGIHTDGPARILHTGTRSVGLGRAKSGRGCLRNALLGRQNG